METYDANSSAAAAGLMGVVLIPALLISLVLIIAFWRIFTKAGKPGWAAIIPIYNLIVFLEIIGKPVWWILLFFVPCVNFVFFIWGTNLLSKSFGQGVGFTIGLLILPYIFYPILGFSNYPYLGPAGLGAINGVDPSIGYRDPFSPQV